MLKSSALNQSGRSSTHTAALLLTVQIGMLFHGQCKTHGGHHLDHKEIRWILRENHRSLFTIYSRNISKKNMHVQRSKERRKLYYSKQYAQYMQPNKIAKGSPCLLWKTACKFRYTWVCTFTTRVPHNVHASDRCEPVYSKVIFFFAYFIEKEEYDGSVLKQSCYVNVFWGSNGFQVDSVL